MHQKNPMFYNALLLTCVNLLLRFAGTSFQVFLSGQIGAAGIGLLQLVMSVGSLSMIAGMAGIRTATMYLTAEELGSEKHKNIPWVLSGCFFYSILCSSTIAILLYFTAPWISENWIGEIRSISTLRLYAAFLPVNCLCGVLTGFFTALNRIKTLAVIEVAEQLISMGITVFFLTFWAQQDSIKSCLSVILGSGFGGCFTLFCLFFLHIKTKMVIGKKISVAKRLNHAAVPLAIADITKAGINTLENLMIPKRLNANPQISSPLAAFGMISGMVFPVLMFPACILFGLAELLIPELARCSSGGSKTRVSYLVRKSLRVSMLYGIFFCGLLFLHADALCITLYRSKEAGKFLRMYALLLPMLYCDAVTDAMTKGLGQQKICVRYNILTSALDVILLYFLLPKYGMAGYFFSFFLTHLLNFILSIRRLFIITGESLSAKVPVLSGAALFIAIRGAMEFHSNSIRAIAYISLLVSLLYLLKIINREDALWIKGLIYKK